MQNIIEAISYYSCGYCTNNQAMMFKKEKKKELIFPAGVFLIKHKKHGYVLYDTGYTTEIYRKKWLFKLYNYFNPTFIERNQMIDQQLKQTGIEPDEIKLIILSHLHPDHIGGTKYFKNARFLISQANYQVLQQKKLKDLIFKDFLPDDFLERVDCITPDKSYESFPYKNSYDLFGDGSLLLSSFDGHASGQLCLYLPEERLFIAADICWGIELLPLTSKIRCIPALIQKDMNAYRASIERLRQIITDGNQVVVSHDPEKRVQEVLK